MFRFGIDHLTSSLAISLAKGEVKGEFSAEAIQKISASNQNVLAIAKGESLVYGINTGFGPLCDTRISSEATSELQRNLLLSHSVGLGEPIDPFIVKLMLILKVHSLAKGFSGISMEVLERIMWHVENNILPTVPEK